MAKARETAGGGARGATAADGSGALRVLRVLTRPNLGGPMRQAVALWHAHRRQGVRTLLAVGVCGRGETSIDLGATGIPIATLAGALAGGRAAEGLVVVPDLRRALAPLGDRRALGQLRLLCQAFEPDVVHTHTSKAGFVGRRAALGAAVPVIAHTWHGHVLRDYYPAPLAFALRVAERRLARRTALLFAVSESCRAEIAELGVARPERISVVPPAVDCGVARSGDRGRARRALGLGEDAVVLGFAGRLVPIKRVDRFVGLVARLDGVVGVVFGDGPERARVEAARGARLSVLGAREDLPALYAALDLLVVPSEREGFPLAGIEAAAASVPALGFDVPGVRELVSACGTGLLVPRGRGVDGLVAAVEACLVGGFPPLGEGAARLVRGCEPDRVARILGEDYRAALRSARSARSARGARDEMGGEVGRDG